MILLNCCCRPVRLSGLKELIVRKWMPLLVSLAGSVWMSGDADAAQLPEIRAILIV